MTGNTPRDGELKTALFFFALAAAAFGVVYFLDDGSVFTSGIAAASVLAVGISRAIAARDEKAKARGNREAPDGHGDG